MLLYHEEILSVLKDVVHSYDVGVASIHQHFELINEQVIQHGLLAQQVFLEYLECE